MLKKLIISINDNEINKCITRDVNIIVLDNDGDRSGESVVTELNNEINTGYFKLNYHNYSEKGLSNIRNEAMRKAMEFNPDYIVSIDDDEYTTPNWLNELVLSITQNKSDIVMGPVIPSIPFRTSTTISFWFKSIKIKNNQKVNFFQSGNYIINPHFLLSTGLKFDNRFNFTGAEDSYFGTSALKKNAKIIWAANAIAYETVSAKRANLKWLVKRCYNGALTFTYILRIEKKYLNIAKKIGVSFFNLILGIISLVFLPFHFKFKYWGILKIAESFGCFAGLMNIKYYAYNQVQKR